MMLGGEHNHFHPGGFHRFAPLVGVQFLQTEHIRIFHAVSPLPACKCVGAEMYKGDEFVFQRRQLIGRWNYVGSLLDDGLFCVVGLYSDGVAEFVLSELQNESVGVGKVAVDGVLLHSSRTPAVVTAYAVYVCVDVDRNEVARGNFVGVARLFNIGLGVWPCAETERFETCHPNRISVTVREREPAHVATVGIVLRSPFTFC